MQYKWTDETHTVPPSLRCHQYRFGDNIKWEIDKTRIIKKLQRIFCHGSDTDWIKRTNYVKKVSKQSVMLKSAGVKEILFLSELGTWFCSNWRVISVSVGVLWVLCLLKHITTSVLYILPHFFCKQPLATVVFKIQVNRV